MAWRSNFVVWLGASLLSACNTLADASDRPAIIAEPTAESREELRRIIETALGQDVLLADDALTESPVLALEQGSDAPPAARGRVIDLPERFELFVNGEGCYLVRMRTGERFRLEQVRCNPASR